jgi:hypothetical protein
MKICVLIHTQFFHRNTFKFSSLSLLIKNLFQVLDPDFAGAGRNLIFKILLTYLVIYFKKII